MRYALVICMAAASGAAQMSSLHEGYAELPGVRLHFVDSGGSGEAVVFLHAGTGSVPMWEPQLAAARAAGFRFIAYDRRDYGKSVVSDPKDAKVGTAADDLAALLDHLKIQRAHIVGIAAGGFVALDFALAYPGRVRSLVPACTIGGIVDDDYVKFGQWMRPPEFLAMPPHLRELGPAYRAVNRAGTERWLEIEHAGRPAGPRAPAQPLKNRMTLEAVAKITAPTLAIAAGADLYAPPEVMRMWVNRIRGAKLVTIPDAGHSANWEDPAAFNKALIGFLKRVK